MASYKDPDKIAKCKKTHIIAKQLILGINDKSANVQLKFELVKRKCSNVLRNEKKLLGEVGHQFYNIL